MLDQQNASYNFNDSYNGLNCVVRNIFLPTTSYLFDLYDPSLSNAEDSILYILKNRETFSTYIVVNEFLRILIIPSIIFYLMIIIGITTIIWTLKIILTYFCIKCRWKYEDEDPEESSKYRYFCKSILALILISLLAFSAAASTQVTLKLSSNIKDEVKNTMDHIKMLENDTMKIHKEIIDFSNFINHTLAKAEDDIKIIPQNISKTILPNDTRNQFSEIIFILKKTYDNYNNYMRTGIDHDKGIEEIKNLIKNLQNNFSELVKIGNNNSISILGELKFFNETYEFPDMKSIYLIVNETFSQLPKKINFYEDLLSSNINEIDSLSSMGNMRNIDKNFANISEIINNYFKRVNETYEETFDQNRKSLQKTMKEINHTPLTISSDGGWNRLIQGTLLCPAVHTLIYVLLMMVVFIIAIYEINLNEANFGVSSKKCSVTAMKMVNIFGLSLVFLGLFLSAGLYAISLFLTVFCRPILSHRIYTEYYDNPEVWGNKTWLDTQIGNWGHNFKVQDILEKCSENLTLYYAFNVEENWNMNQLLERFDIKIRKEDLQIYLEETISSLQNLDLEELKKAKNTFEFGEKLMTKQFTDNIIYDVEVIVKEKTIQKIDTYLKNNTNLKENETLIFQSIRRDFEKLTSHETDKIIGLLVDFKYNLKLAQEQVAKAIYLQAKIVKIIENNKTEIARAQTDYTLETINDIIERIEDEILDKVKNEIGKCKFIPDFINREVEVFCKKAPTVLNITWFMLLINSIILICCFAVISNLTGNIQNTEASSSKISWQNRILVHPPAARNIPRTMNDGDKNYY